jgi:hypothetical protein
MNCLRFVLIFLHNRYCKRLSESPFIKKKMASKNGFNALKLSKTSINIFSKSCANKDKYKFGNLSQLKLSAKIKYTLKKKSKLKFYNSPVSILMIYHLFLHIY